MLSQYVELHSHTTESWPKFLATHLLQPGRRINLVNNYSSAVIKDTQAVCVPVCFPDYLQRGSLVLPRKQAPKGQMTEMKGPFYLQTE